MRFSLSPGRLELSGHSAGRGEAHAFLAVEYKGTDAEIAFNPDYVVDGLKNSESGIVKLEFNEKTSPGKFLLGENYIYIVMPITIMLPTSRPEAVSGIATSTTSGPKMPSR